MKKLKAFQNKITSYFFNQDIENQENDYNNSSSESQDGDIELKTKSIEQFFTSSLLKLGYDLPQPIKVFNLVENDIINLEKKVKKNFQRQNGNTILQDPRNFQQNPENKRLYNNGLSQIQIIESAIRSLIQFKNKKNLQLLEKIPI